MRGATQDRSERRSSRAWPLPWGRRTAATNRPGKRLPSPTTRRIVSLARNSRADGSSKLPFGLVALAGSAGALHALSSVLSALSGAFPVPIVVVQHLDPRHRSLMADILSRRTSLKVKEAEEGEVVSAGTIYIAAPNRHLL